MHLRCPSCVPDSSSGALKVFTAAGNIDAYVGEDGTAELHSQQGTNNGAQTNQYTRQA